MLRANEPAQLRNGKHTIKVFDGHRRLVMGILDIQWLEPGGSGLPLLRPVAKLAYVTISAAILGLSVGPSMSTTTVDVSRGRKRRSFRHHVSEFRTFPQQAPVMRTCALTAFARTHKIILGAHRLRPSASCSLFFSHLIAND